MHVCVKSALRAGGSERQRPLNMPLIRETHTYNGPNEAVKAVGSVITLLCSCHFLFLMQLHS